MIHSKLVFFLNTVHMTVRVNLIHSKLVFFKKTIHLKNEQCE
jgi:hypothetical protein